jgi:hypothetical protein
MNLVLSRAVLVHLEAQLQSARRLLDLVLQQGRAIRARDVEAVLTTLSAIQAEVDRRTHLEAVRTDLLARAGEALGVPAQNVTLSQITRLMPPDDAQRAQELSTELTGLLGEVSREHAVNRALMRQELTFLSHLTRLVGAAEPDTGYRPPAAPQAPAAAPPRLAAGEHRLLDLQA